MTLIPTHVETNYTILHYTNSVIFSNYVEYVEFLFLNVVNTAPHRMNKILYNFVLFYSFYFIYITSILYNPFL